MRKYLQAYADVLQSGKIKEQTIKGHIDNHIAIDKYLPDSSSFFYVVQFSMGKYHFLGKQQEHVSGYTNEEFLETGIELFLRCLHPEEINIILKEIYRDIIEFISSQQSNEEKFNLQIQYNYRFRRKNGEFVNLLDQIQALELDGEGRVSLALGNVIMLQTTEILPLRLSIKQFKSHGISKTVFNRVYTPWRLNHKITPREEEVLRHLASGKTSKEVARILFISPNTVDTHRRNLLKKLACKSVVELTQIAFKNALL
jgi:DNA-binding CsgD family transcriptional regulator